MVLDDAGKEKWLVQQDKRASSLFKRQRTARLRKFASGRARSRLKITFKQPGKHWKSSRFARMILTN